MPNYQVDISSYNTFRAAVLSRAAQGLGFDLDGAYGYQCWDLGQLLYSQLGRTFTTAGRLGQGDSGVYTAWAYPPAKEINSRAPFAAIPIMSIKRGDMIIWNKGRYSWDSTGHNGYADEDYNPNKNTIMTLGQNQVNASATVGHIPTLNALSTNMILGAFRYTPWQGGGPSPTPSKPWRSSFPWVLYARKLRGARY